MNLWRTCWHSLRFLILKLNAMDRVMPKTEEAEEKIGYRGNITLKTVPKIGTNNKKAKLRLSMIIILWVDDVDGDAYVTMKMILLGKMKMRMIRTNGQFHGRYDFGKKTCSYRSD